jgi:hypothetical protein
MRFLIANALRPESAVTFANFGDFVPDIYDESDASLAGRPDPRVLKSHEPYDERYPRVIYLVRHPADVAVSYYHYLVKMRTIGSDFELARFVDSFVGGHLDEFGTWGDHVLGWLDARDGDERFVLVRYEDLLAEPEGGLRAALAVALADVPEADVAAAVQRSSAEELRRLERETAHELPTFRGSRPDVPFVRRAGAGAGRDELTPELYERVLAAWPEALERVGYSSPAR